MKKVSIVQLFQKKYAYALTVGIGLSALPALVGLNGIIFYASSIFDSAGFSVKLGTMALALFQVSAAGLCLGCSLTGLAFLFEDHHLLGDFSPYIALIGILIYVALYPIGIGGGSAIIISEIFPLNIKWSAGSIAAVVTNLSSWIVSYAFNFSMEWSSSGTIPSLVQIVGLFFIPESPRWLLMKSKTNAFETALQRLRGGSVVNEAADLRIYFVSYPVGMGGAASVKVSEVWQLSV
uniref:Major facilitator superfamily (MFS) profile domain-containing protein n=1 Tax=Chenopodium quinoa TaxID=63459 RepID=A0A803KP95_CHEQI